MAFETDDDRRNQREIAALLAQRWQCEVLEFGGFSAIDWFARRQRRFVAVLELKCRPNRAHDSFPTQLIDLRKWMALTFAAMAFAVPAFLVVRYTDGLFMIDIRTLDTRQTMVTGRTDRVAVTSYDQEPVIEFPVAAMTKIE